ncbi:MAG: gamma subclass chorismate mutase AroQ [Proteobacteria bacterium]|nr:gamma subclass chorismate mutase AroQ [Pseudomonadota bacterium]
MARNIFRNGRRILNAVLLLPALLMSTNTFANELLDLVEQRLGYMKDVAAYKWQRDLPIENRERENVVLVAAVQTGLRFKLTKGSSRHFFEVQIDAAKEVQNYWYEQWRQNPEAVPTGSVDLDGKVRPALINLGERISAELAREPSSLTQMSIKGLSNAAVLSLDNAARAIEVYPDQLSQVLDSGVLRVGTTGDYAPFSHRPGSTSDSNSTQWTGIDIDLAHNLALFLDVEILWVHTSWPKLMNDLHSGHYDIGMSGISITPKRLKTAFFSTPYHSGGKTPIIRCSDRGRYSSLQNIDLPTTRLIVNPGGTNQKFVNSNIHRAMILVHNDNRSIFDELIMDRADVMITDQIEVQLQVGQHPELCAAMREETLTFSQKAFLLPQDKAWKNYIDNWLGSRLQSGLVKQRFDAHLSARGDI